MTHFRFVLPFAAGAVACLCADAAARGPDAVGSCYPGQAGCNADAPGDESELLQVKVKAHAVTNRSTYEYDQAQAMALAGLAKLTYCSGQRGTGPSAEKTCGSKGFCEDAGVKIVKGSVRTFTVADGDSAQALVAVMGWLERRSRWGAAGSMEPGIVIAIRGAWVGTNNGARTKQREYQPLEDIEGCSDCRVHGGTQQTWSLLKAEIFPALRKMRCTGSTPLYFTGVDLGGAVSYLGMLESKLKGMNVKHSYVFGTPRVFNDAGVRYFNEVMTGSEEGAAVTRVTNANDITTTYPSGPQPDGSEYAYTWPEVHYSAPDESTGKVTYEVCMDASTDCGTLSHAEELCGAGECDHHLTFPIAPAGNIAVFTDMHGTCNQGRGTVEAPHDLPQVAQEHEPTTTQLRWAWGQMGR